MGVLLTYDTGSAKNALNGPVEKILHPPHGITNDFNIFAPIGDSLQFQKTQTGQTKNMPARKN